MRLTVHSRAWLRVVLSAVAVFSGASLSHSQVRPGPMPPSSREQPPSAPPVISIEAALVNLDVLVTDEDGLVLAGLKKGNFRVLDNGAAQIIADFEATGAPITIVMLLEYSGNDYDYFAYKAASWG